MNTLKWLVLSLTLALSMGLVAPAEAHPARTICRGELDNQHIAGDLIVPAGETCQLINVTVLGDVRVNQRAGLEAIASRIEGALIGAGFERVGLRATSIGGRVRLAGGASASLEQTLVEGPVRLVDQVDARVLQSRVTGDLVLRGTREVALLCGTTVEGHARLADHRGGLLIGDAPDFPGLCQTNAIRGSLLVHHNRSTTIVANTTVGRNLVCAANDPAPTVYGNQVGGNARGQCGAGEPVATDELGADE